VIVSATPGPYGFLGYWLARRLRVPLCAGHHTRFDKLVELYWRGRIGRWVGSALEQINGALFRRSALVVATSPEMVEHARAVGARNVQLMGTPINRRFLLSPPPAPRQVRSVLYAGRLASEKNIEAVLEAAERLSHLRFVIAGNGPQRPLVEKKSEKLRNLYFVGWVPRGDLVSYFNESDLLVLPSHVESFGTVAVEAMARRRPVIVSPQCGILDWAPLKNAVISMLPNESLAEAIKRVAAWHGAELAASASAAYEAVHSLNTSTVDRWLDALSELADLSPNVHSHEPRLCAGVSA
jgi:glycosyltransferase involved in cell wall biosynthesis